MTAVLQADHPPGRRKAALEGSRALSDAYGEIAQLLAPLPTSSSQLSSGLRSPSSFTLSKQGSRRGSMHLASVFSPPSPPTTCLVSAVSTQSQSSQTSSVLPPCTISSISLLNDSTPVGRRVRILELRRRWCRKGEEINTKKTEGRSEHGFCLKAFTFQRDQRK
jgi:hypothetical protein